MANNGRQRVLVEHLLDDARLAEALTDVLIPAYDVVQRCPFYFDSAQARRDPAEDFQCGWRRGRPPPPRPTSSLITSTRRADGVFVDRGLEANNPAMCAFTEAQKGLLDREALLMVSLGTGEMTRSLPYAQVRDWAWPSGPGRFSMWCSTG